MKKQSKNIRTPQPDALLELLALETVALDIVIERHIALPSNQCALRTVAAAPEFRELLINGVINVDSVRLPIDELPELHDLFALEAQHEAKGYSRGAGCAVYAALEGTA